MDDTELLETAECAVRLCECELRTELPTWYERLQAVAAECFTREDACTVASAAVLTAYPQMPTETRHWWARALPHLLVHAWTGPQSVSARNALLSVGRKADAQSNL